jgi:hypothetical protein
MFKGALFLHNWGLGAIALDDGGRDSFQNFVQMWKIAHKYFIAQRHGYLSL